MKKHAFIFLLCFSTLSGAQSLYKWVDAQGKVSYSDQPPPPTVTVKDLSSTLNTLGAGQAQAEPLSLESQRLVANSPVVIYTTTGCKLCDQGRDLLRKKGVPFTEKTVTTSEDLKALGAQFNSQTLPVLAVGKTNINGFGTSQWNEALNQAGYSAAPAAPKTYLNGAVSPLTPATAKPASATEAPPKI